MKLVQAIAWLVIAIMSVNLVNVLLHSGMDHGVGLDTFLAGTKDPWQTLIDHDLVSGLLFTCAGIIQRERGGRGLETMAWIWMALWWGNIVVAVYMLVAAYQSSGDWPRFFLGRHAPAPGIEAVWRPAPAIRLLCCLAALATLAYLALGLVRVGFAGLPSFGYLAAFLPIALSLGLLATRTDSRRRAGRGRSGLAMRG